MSDVEGKNEERVKMRRRRRNVKKSLLFFPKNQSKM